MIDEVFPNTYMWLPADSYHMTIFDVLCECAIGKIKASGIDVDAADYSFDQVDAEMKSRFDSVDCSDLLKCFDMKLSRFMIGFGGCVTIWLEPVDPTVADALEAYRTRFSKALNIPNKPYNFHITLAYALFDVMHEDREDLREYLVRDCEVYLKDETIRLDVPTFTYFNSMERFDLERVSV